MNDAWMAILLAFVVPLAVMAAVARFLLHFSIVNTVAFALSWAVAVALRAAWGQRRSG